MSASTTDLLAAIDRHLAAIPAGRSTVTVDDHRDVLLDLRTMVSAGAPAAEPVDDSDPETVTGPVTEPVAEGVDPIEAVEPIDVSTFPSDFPDEIAVDDVEIDPALTGLDLALEIDLAAEARVDDFPDTDPAEDFPDTVAEDEDVFDGEPDADPAETPVVLPEDAAGESAPEPDSASEPEVEPEPAPAPERVPVVHLRLATSARGVIGRCGLLVDTDAGDSSTPWTEEVTCGACVDAVASPSDSEAETDTDAPAAGPDDATEPADDDPTSAEAEGEAQPVGAVADIPDDDEESWVHAGDDDDPSDDSASVDAPVVHQLAEVEGTGHGKNKVAKAKCGNVELAPKTDRFVETSSWPEDVTCPNCIALRHQAQPDQAAA